MKNNKIDCGKSLQFAAIMLLAVTLLARPGETLAQTTSCVAPPSGLVSWWAGEGNANDLISNNRGILVAGASFAAGQVGQAFTFDGSSQYVRIPNAANLNPTGSFTVEAWIYPTGTNFGTIFGKWGDQGDYGGQRAYNLHLDGNNNLNFSISDDAHQFDTNFQSMSSPIGCVALNAWNHVVAVYDQSTGTRTIYVNGAAVSSRTDPPITVTTSTADAAIGGWLRSSTDAAGFFPGLIDEVSFYNRALSTRDILAMYSAGAAGKCHTSFDAVRDFNFVMNDSSQTWQYGYSDPNGVGFTNYDPAFDDIGGNARTYKKTDSDMAVVFNKTQQNLNYNACTMQQPDVLGMFPGNDGRKTIVRWTAPAAGTYMLTGRFQNIDIATSDASIIHVLPDGTVSETLLQPVFINASSCRQTTVSDPFTIPVTVNAGDHVDFRVGRGNNDYTFDGTGLAVTITNGLNQDTCTAQPSGLVSWWRAENDSTDAGGGNNGTSEGVTFIAGKVGEAFNFAGTSSRIAIPDSPTLALTSSLSIDAWVYVSALPTDQGMIVFRGDNRPLLDPYYMSVTNSGNARFHIEDANGNATNVEVPISQNQWVHLAGTLDDATGAMMLYVNGTPVNRKFTTVRPFGPLNGGGVAIGNLNDGDSSVEPFTGLIDELHIFNRALSAAEVQAIFTSGTAGICVGTATPTLTLVPTAPASIGSPMHFAASFSGVSTDGWTVRVQSSTDPTTESSWTDLPDGNGGDMNADPNNPGNYTLHSTNYPQKSGVFFRAIAAKQNETDVKSKAQGPFDLAVNTPPPVLTLAGNPPANPGDPMHFQATLINISATGWAVRVQSSFTPDKEDSWSDLPDGNGAQMNADPNNPGNYMMDTTAYPGGGAVYFRAIASKQNQNDIISAPTSPLHLNQASLAITASVSSKSDPANGAYAATGDTVTYTINVVNVGGAPARNLVVTARVPTYQQAGTDLHTQFPYVLVNAGGKYSSATNLITWNLGDFTANPGTNTSATLTFTVQISKDVRFDQAIDLIDYSVTSQTKQPAGTVLGTPTHSTQIVGAISLKVVPNENTVAPGGLFSYKVTVANRGSTPVAHAVVLIDVPDAARFARTYSTNSGTVAGVSLLNSTLSNVSYQQLFYANGAHSQVYINVGKLAAASDRTGHDSASMNVTFQAQWADPSDVPKLTLSQYGAAFLNDAGYVAMSNAYHNAGFTMQSPGPIDLFSIFNTSTNDVAYIQDSAGVVNLPLQGITTGAPILVLLKQISEGADGAAYDDTGSTSNIVTPGSQLTFLLGLSNGGGSEADEVYINDRLPDSTSFVSAQLVRVTKKLPNGQTVPDDSPSTIKSLPNFRTTLDPDGHHVVFSGLHVDAADAIAVQYTVKVASAGSAPASGTVLNPISNFSGQCQDSDGSSVGTSSSPHTPCGIYAGGPIVINNPVMFPQPIQRPFPATATPVIDVNAAANQLSAIYQKNPNAQPYINNDKKQPFVAGAQRYYIHYATNQAANNVDLDVPLPAHTVFYRASFIVSGKVVPTPGNYRINSPTFLTNGIVNFHFPNLNAGANGDVMVEFIVTSDIVQPGQAFVAGGTNPPLIRMHAGAANSNAMAVESAADPDSLITLNSAATPILSGTLRLDASYLGELQRPSLKIVQIAPKEVKPGDTFQIQVVVYNDSEVPASDQLFFTIPSNTEYVSADAGQSMVVVANPPVEVLALLASGNGPTDTWGHEIIARHTAGALTVTLRATGPVGSDIGDSQTGVLVITYTDFGNTGIPAVPNFVGSVHPPAAVGSLATHIVDQPGNNVVIAPSGGSVFQAPFGQNNEGFLIDMGRTGLAIPTNPTNTLVIGPASVVQTSASNIVAQGGGNIVAQGGGNLISLGGSTAAGLLAKASSIVAQGGGNLVIGEGGTGIVAQGGGNILAVGTASIVAQGGGNIVAQGGGNIVAQGGGNIVAQGGGNIVAQGGGNIVAAGGGNIVAQGGGNILSTGGSNLVGNSGGTIVAQGGGNILMTNRATSGIVATGGGNIVAAGGGNIVAQGGGN